MSLLVVGLSYRTAPVDLLERTSVGPDDLPKLLGELRLGGHLSEAVVLSTCNRVEVYADVDRFHGGVHDISSALARQAGVEVQALGEHLYVHYEDAAVLHVFSVACGLDSMVVGESQILGQLRAAYAVAAGQHAVGRNMHELFQQALRVGKRVHAETGIDRAGASVVSVALHEAERTLGSLADRRVLVVGAGSMGALAASTLYRRGVAELTVVNRSVDRAERLVANLGAPGVAAPGAGADRAEATGAEPAPTVRAAGLDQVAAALAAADLVVACTGAVGLVVPYELVESAVEARAGRDLVLLDLALPHDVDTAVAGLRGVRYVDLAALQSSAHGVVAEQDVALAREIVATEVAAFLAGQRAMAVAPTVTALRVLAAEVVDAELLRLDGRLPGLHPAVRAEVAHAVHRVVQTLLHVPTVRVKQFAARPGGDAYATVLRELFGLDPAATEAVSSVPPELTLAEAIDSLEELL